MIKSSYRSLWLAMCWGLLAAHSAGQARAETSGLTQRVSLSYTVAIKSPASQRAEVTAALTGLEAGETDMRWEMQQRFAFVRLPEPLLDGPVRAVADGHSVSVDRTGPYEWNVAGRGQREITLSYVVPLTHRTLDAVGQRDAYEYPYLAADHGLLVTPTLFLWPKDITPVEIRVRFALPSGWKVVSPWRSVDEHEFDPRGRESLLNDLVAIGNWHTYETCVGEFVGTIAMAPGQEALEKTAVEPIRRIVEYELELFGRPAQGSYLFVFGRPDATGTAGSPKTRSMTLSVEPRLAEHAAEYLPHLIAHEFYHTWSAALFEMPDELRWVNEGFTDYYAYLVPARLGLTTWSQFADTLGEKMRSCAENPHRDKLALSAAGGDVFFADHDAYNLVYDGGLLIAAWLDRAIRRLDRGKTLDDVMRTFNNDRRWTRNDAQPSLKDFLDVTEQFVSQTTAATLERFVTQPYDFDPLTAFAELGLTIRHERTRAKVDLRANLDGTRVIDIDPRGLGFRVGVRPDDRLIEINGQSLSNASEVRAAWQKPVGNRIRVTLKRGEHQLTLDQPVPVVEKFLVPVEPWREHE
jgi:predicted metalloprotease with PDZ domain